MTLEVVPMTITAAKEYVRDVHRHHKPPQGALFAIGLSDEGNTVGCVMVGRPVARMLQDGKTCEVIRLATDGTQNACSMLYRAAWRAAKAMGYKRLITYTLPEEGGASLRAAGFTLHGLAGGGKWVHSGAERANDWPLQQKHRWELRA